MILAPGQGKLNQGKLSCELSAVSFCADSADSLTREGCWRIVLRKAGVEIANSNLKVVLQREC
jgi:hypothetical protein